MGPTRAHADPDSRARGPRPAEGAAWYVATRLDPAATAALAGRVAAAAGILVDGSGVAVTRRGRFVFAINRGVTPAAVDVRGVDLLTGAPFPGTVPAGAAAVVKIDPAEVG